MHAFLVSQFIKYLPKPMSCSRNEIPRQMLSELELFTAVIKLGSAVKCGTIKIIDPSPIMTAPKTITIIVSKKEVETMNNIFVNRNTITTLYHNNII